MKTTLLVAVVCVLTACTNAGPSVGPRSSGSIAASKDDALLYVADTDKGVLGVIDLKQQNKKIAVVKVGAAPWRVVVGADETIYVANRGSRSVSVIRRGEWAVAAELATDVDPVGMVVSADGRSLYVVCATSSTASEFGTLTAFDTGSLSPKWSLSVGDEPRGIALINDKRAVVSLFREGEVVQVDLEKGTLANNNHTTLYASSNRGALTTTTGPASTRFHPRAASDVVATPDGNRIFVTGMLSRESVISIPPSPTRPYYQAQGPRLAGSVSTTAVFTLDTKGDGLVPQVDDVASTSPLDLTAAFPQTSYAVSGSGSSLGFAPPGGTNQNPVLQGPTVAVTDSSGDWLYVVNRETSTVALISAQSREAVPTEGCSNYFCAEKEIPSVHSTAGVGPGTDGIVIMGDNKTVYVYSQFDHSVRRITYEPNVKGIATQGVVATVGGEVLSPEDARGRKLFFDANDRRVSGLTASVACSSCHLEGRDDGHVWSFPDGPRQTPTLAGRGMAETAPFHWSGEFPEMTAFLNHTVVQRMGGSGLDSTSASALTHYMAKLPAPENPYLKVELTPQQTHGRQVFAKAQCNTCHSGQWLTNNTNAAVGTLAPRDNGLVVMKGLNVPSLRGLARSGPYLHDGSVVTLGERVINNSGDKHGKTSDLTKSEVDDLVAYLQTL